MTHQLVYVDNRHGSPRKLGDNFWERPDGWIILTIASCETGIVALIRDGVCDG